jgi:hypothetical protein
VEDLAANVAWTEDINQLQHELNKAHDEEHQLTRKAQLESKRHFDNRSNNQIETAN